jgi:hypothetical protein
MCSSVDDDWSLTGTQDITIAVYDYYLDYVVTAIDSVLLLYENLS